MKDILDNDLQKLKFAVESQTKKKIVYAKDCTMLAAMIFEQTKRQVSGSTLKRLWGVVKSDFLPSSFTLDTLSLFLGYQDWADFKKNADSTRKNAIVAENTWYKIKEKYEKISWYSYNSIKSKIGFIFSKTISRPFAEERIINLMDSNKTATAFISPGGYGKSPLMTSLYEKLFFSDQSPFSDDIVLLIDCAILNHLINEDFNFDHYLIEMLGYNFNTNVRDFFKQNESLRKGRIVLILENLHEISTDRDKTSWFIKSLCMVIATNADTTWFKLIVCCRSHFWRMICQHFDTPMSREAWFDVEIQPEDSSYSNIPDYSEQEINEILKLNNLKNTFKELQVFYPDLARLIKIPYFLHNYITLYCKDNYINELDLLHYFTDQILFSGSNGSQKNRIINAFIKASNYALSGSKIQKKSIEKYIVENQQAYNELLMYGVLVETNQIGHHLDYKTNIRIVNPLVFEFLLSNLWLREYELNSELIENVMKIYEKNPEMQHCLFKWFVRYAIAEKKVDVLKNIFKSFSHLDDGDDIRAIAEHPLPFIHILAAELHRSFDFKKELLFHYASERLSQRLYFELYTDIDFLVHNLDQSLDFYIKANQDHPLEVWGLMLKLWANLLSDNKKSSDILGKEIFQRKKTPKGTEYTDIVYRYVYMLHEYSRNGAISRETVLCMYEFEEQIADSNILTPNLQVSFYYSMIDAFDYCESFTNLINFYQLMLTRQALMSVMKNTNRFLYLQYLYARALLNKGRVNEAFSNYYKLRLPEYPLHSYYCMQVRILFVKFDFLLFDNRTHEALECANEISEICHILKFEYLLKKIKEKTKGLSLQFN